MNKMDDQRQAIEWSYDILDLKPQESSDFETLKNQLTHYLNQLIQEDFNRLISILYRVDISREKLTTALSDNPHNQSAGLLIANLIIERQIQKIQTRRSYKEKGL